MTVAILAKTKAGVTVGGLRSHPDGRVASAAKALLSKWKALAEASGVKSAAAGAGTGSNGVGSPMVATGSDITATPAGAGVLTSTPSMASSVLSAAQASVARSRSVASSDSVGAGGGGGGSSSSTTGSERFGGAVKNPTRMRGITMLTDLVVKAVNATMAAATAAAAAAASASASASAASESSTAATEASRGAATPSSSPTAAGGAGASPALVEGEEGSDMGGSTPRGVGTLVVPTAEEVRGNAEAAAIALEAAVWTRHCGGGGSGAGERDYNAAMRTFLLALPRNGALLTNLYHGFIEAARVAAMSADELVSPEAKAAAEAMRREQ